MPFKLRLIPAAAAACLLASCGGGGGSSSEPAPAPTPSAGVAVDGYLIGSTVLCDSNGNGLSDAGELSVGTDAGGNFRFNSGCTAALVVRGGSSVDTGLPFKGVLKAPAGATVVSPLTTMVAAGMTNAQVVVALGLTAGTDLLKTDPAASANGALSNPGLMKATLAMQQLLQKTTELFAGLGGVNTNAAQQAIYTEVAAAFATTMPAGAALNSGTTLDAAVIGGLVKGAAERVKSAAGVSDAVKTALQGLNSDALGVVTAGGLKAQAEGLLKASDAELTAVTTARQTDTTITTFVVANKAQLTAAPTAATTALGQQLTDDVTGVEPPPPPNNYLALGADSIGVVKGGSTTTYSMSAFQSAAGISMSWPVPKAAMVTLTLAETGSYALAADQTLSAAVSITETTATGKGELKAYIENVAVAKTAGGLQITVPSATTALMYGVSSNGQKRATIDFANSVAGVTNTLKTAAGSSNRIVFGEVVDYAVNKIGADFTGIGALRGKYMLTIVLNGVPLRKADGSPLPELSVDVPTVLDGTGATTASKRVTGPGIVGYVTLTD